MARSYIAIVINCCCLLLPPIIKAGSGATAPALRTGQREQVLRYDPTALLFNVTGAGVKEHLMHDLRVLLDDHTSYDDCIRLCSGGNPDHRTDCFLALPNCTRLCYDRISFSTSRSSYVITFCAEKTTEFFKNLWMLLPSIGTTGTMSESGRLSSGTNARTFLQKRDVMGEHGRASSDITMEQEMSENGRSSFLLNYAHRRLRLNILSHLRI
jgi:hypothetical protein